VERCHVALLRCRSVTAYLVADVSCVVIVVDGGSGDDIDDA
jgi:hypothetical protein